MYHDFSNSKVGDEVVIHSYINTSSIGKIIRLTNNFIFMSVGKNLSGETIEEKFRIKDGNKVGHSSFYRSYIEPMTPEIRADMKEKAERRQCLDNLRARNWLSFSTDELKEIVATIHAIEAKKNISKS